MTTRQSSERLLTAVLGLLLFGAGCVVAIAWVPWVGGGGVVLGVAIGGTIVTMAVRARLAGHQPPRSVGVAFVVAFLSVVLLVFVRPLALGYLSGLFSAGAAGLLVISRANKPEG
jgi:hypothetical protein